MYNKKELKVTPKAEGKKNPYKKDIIYDPMGQWAHPGEVTRIPSGDITMQGVPYPVMGIDNFGNVQMMMPGQDYSFPGDIVDEYPMAKKGGVPRSLKKMYTSKNIQSSINEILMKRNDTLFGHSGRRYYKPMQDGGDYNMQRALELGYNPDETEHWPSVDSETGMWLKSKNHPTAWKEFMYGQLNADLAKNLDVRVNPEGYFGDNQLQYVPKKQDGGWLDEFQNGGPLTINKDLNQAFMRGEGRPVPVKELSLLEKTQALLNPNNWGVNDYSDKGTFSKAYESAKKKGEEEFMFNGKRYTTDYAGTPRQEVGKYGVKGKKIDSKLIDTPAHTALFPPFGRYLPGHIASEMIIPDKNEPISVDYSSDGNRSVGIDIKPGQAQSFYSYGPDFNKFADKVQSLPGGFHGLFYDDEYNPSTWNLFNNNCADNVCDAFGIPRTPNTIELPITTLQKIKNKYPTLNVTGRTAEDYKQLMTDLKDRLKYPVTNLQEFEKLKAKRVLDNADKLTSLYYSPETHSQQQYDIAEMIQNALVSQGYDLPKSYIGGKKGLVDQVIGPETEAAIKKWKKEHKQKGGQVDWLSEFE